jgi:hypothetical protein
MRNCDEYFIDMLEKGFTPKIEKARTGSVIRWIKSETTQIINNNGNVGSITNIDNHTGDLQL